MRPAFVCAALVTLPLLAVAGGSGEAVAADPITLVRALQKTQDEIAHGSTDAHLRQRQLVAEINQELGRVADSVWKDPRQVRAAVAFVLSGGGAGVLRKVAGGLAAGHPEEKLVQGALAYAEGRNGAAAETLGKLDVRSLDPSVAGHVALVQSELLAKSDPKRSIALLDDARLISPGTLVEEAALRREVAAVAAQSDFARFQALSSLYLRRFPNSVYAGSFRQQYADIVAGTDFAKQPQRLSMFADALTGMKPADQRDLSLLIARQGLIKTNLIIARQAAEAAIRLSKADSVEGTRARVYQAAILVISAQIDEVLSALDGLDREKLTPEERDLADAAFAVGREIKREPPQPDGRPPQAIVDETLGAFNGAERASAAVAKVDRMLAEVSR